MEKMALEEVLQRIYEKNPFINLLQMKMESGTGEGALFSMPIISGIHTNLHGNAHGGAIFSLADTSMGASCAFHNKKVVTLDMNMNYLRPAFPDKTLYAQSKIIHNGRTTLVIECEVRDEDKNFIAKSTGTFFVAGKFQEQ